MAHGPETPSHFMLIPLLYNQVSGKVNMNGTQAKRYTDLNSHLKGLFGKRVQKLTVDAGFTCPNRDGLKGTGGCIFCNENGSGNGAHILGTSIADQISQGREALFKRYKAKLFLVYFQAYSNTYAPVDKLKALYDEALDFDDVVGLSIGTRPDCIDEEKLALLHDYSKEKLIWLEYGLQSPHDKTLAAINRGHDVACFKEAVALTRKVAPNVKICAHIILGLPGGDPRNDVGGSPAPRRSKNRWRQTPPPLCGQRDPPLTASTSMDLTPAWRRTTTWRLSATSSNSCHRKRSSNASPEIPTGMNCVPPQWPLKKGTTPQTNS